MPRETLEAHAPVPSRWLPNPVPGYKPTSEGAPQLPTGPKAPHFPHFKHAGRIVALGFAGALALTAAEGFIKPNGTSTDPIARAGEVPAEQMRYPWDTGNVYLELNLTETEDNGVEFNGASITTEPEVLQRDEDRFVVLVLGEEYGEEEDFLGHVQIPLINDLMRGGVWEKEVTQDGKTVLNSDGEPILHPYGYQDPEPGQEGMV